MGTKLTIETIEPFGVFLNDGGFIGISDISRYLGRRVNSKAELEEALPPGTEVDVELKKRVKDTRERVREVHYWLKGVKTT